MNVCLLTMEWPLYAGGIGIVHGALENSWKEIDESRLREYAYASILERVPWYRR